MKYFVVCLTGERRLILFLAKHVGSILQIFANLGKNVENLKIF